MKQNSDVAMARFDPALTCGACAGPVFISIFLIEGVARKGYDPLRHAVSSLSLGATGWTQIANFIVTGFLVIAFARGLRRQSDFRSSFWGPALISLTGMGLVGAGIFVSDPLFGYPPEMPLQVAQYTIHGHLHDLFSMLFFAGIPGACLVLARRFSTSGDRIWAAFSIATAIAMILGFVLTALGFKQTPGFVESAGGLQRLTIIIGFTWLSLLAARQLKSSPPTHGTSGSPSF